MAVDHIKWVEYLHAGPADEAAMDQLEAVLDQRFPPDGRALLMEHQGKLPEPSWLKASFRHPQIVGPLLLVQAGEPRRRAYAIAFQATALHEDHPRTIVPIVKRGGAWLAYDFGDDALNPPVVFINPDEPGDSPGARTWVADSLTDLLAQLEPEPPDEG